MSLEWKWDKKCGEAVLREGDREFTLNLYQGNALLIFINEFKEDGKDVYSVWNFIIDKKHGRDCLGLSRGQSNIFEKVSKLTLYKNICQDVDIIAGLFAAGMDNVTIEVLENPPK